MRRPGYVVPPDPAVWKCRVNGAWLPGGRVTGAPLTVAAKAPGAPAITVTGPVAGMACDWPEKSVVVKSTEPVAVSVASTQHSPWWRRVQGVAREATW